MKKILTNSLAVLALGTTMMAPSIASAQSWRNSSQHRQEQKNQWKNLAIGAGALGLIGALTHNNSLTLGGLAGAAYSGYRYNEENKNSRNDPHARFNENRNRNSHYGQSKYDSRNGW